MIKFIALFFPALISMSIYIKRQSPRRVFKIELLIRYGIYTLLINWCVMSFMIYILGIEYCTLDNMENWSFFTKYVLITAFLAWTIPYIEEIVGKSISVRFHVKSKLEEKGEDNQNN